MEYQWENRYSQLCPPSIHKPTWDHESFLCSFSVSLEEKSSVFNGLPIRDILRINETIMCHDNLLNKEPR